MDINFLLVAVLLLMMICGINGYRRGFLRIVISLIGMIAIIATVTVVSPYVSDYLTNHTNTYDTIRQKIITIFAENNEQRDNTIQENQDLTIDSYDIPEILKGNLKENNNQEMYQSLMVTVFEDYVSAYLAKMAINAIAFVGLFVVLWIFLWFILLSADIVTKIPGLNKINRFLGMLTGLSTALIIVWVFFFIVIVFLGNDVGSAMMKEVKESRLLTFMFNSNYLLRYIT